MRRLCLLSLALLALSLPLPAAGQEAWQWIYDPPAVPGPQPALFYGIPRSDAVQFAARCQPGGAQVGVTLAGDVAGLPAGARSTLEMTGPGFRAAYPVEVVRYEGALNGVIVTIGLQDGLWDGIAGQPWLHYAVAGRDGVYLPTQGAAPLLARFLQDCGGPGAPARALKG